MSARRRFELPSYGLDEFKQLSGSDPFGSKSFLGLRVPTMPTAALAATNGVPVFSNRYLFAACSFSVGEGSLARIIGYRQFVELGFLLAAANGPRPVIFDCVTPGWSFSDQTVSWHFRRLGPPSNSPQIAFPNPANATDLAGLKFRWSGGTPALLYESVTVPVGAFYPDLTAYVPPGLGKPWGTPLTDDPYLSNIYGLQTPWKTSRAWRSLDIEVRGPDTICAFISVGQTDPAHRPEMPSVSPASFGTGISPEDAFIQTAQNTFGLSGAALPIYWKVGASLIVEVDSLVSEVRGVLGGDR